MGNIILYYIIWTNQMALLRAELSVYGMLEMIIKLTGPL